MQKYRKSLLILISISIGCFPLSATPQIIDEKKDKPAQQSELKAVVESITPEYKDDILFIQEEEEEAEIFKQSNGKSFSMILQLKDYPRIEEYISNGENINHVIYDGNTIVNVSSFHRDIELLLFAAANKANLSHLNNNGESILYWGGSGRKVDYLIAIKQAMSPKAFNDLMATTTKRKRTPLHGAVLYDAGAPTIEWLLNNNVLLEAKDENGRTALHYAAGMRRWDALEQLLQRGANILAVDSEGLSVEDYIFEKFDVITLHKFYKYLSLPGKQKMDARLSNLNSDFAQQLKTTGFDPCCEDPNLNKVKN